MFYRNIILILLASLHASSNVSSTFCAEDGGIVWAYKQTTGELLFNGKVVAKGYSGHGEGLNNPEKESVRDVGPIPRGEWNMGDAFKHETKGPLVIRLSPAGHKAHGRDGFLIHGDNSKMDRSASNGCIILAKEVREKIAKSGAKKLVVEK